MDSTDSNLEGAEESVPVNSNDGKRARTVDMGRKGTIQFIKLIKSAVCLWNRKHPLYKHRISQCNAWKEISMRMGVPSSELQYKWRSLQSSYRHFRSSYSKARLQGAYPTTKWFAYDAMRFLSVMKEVDDTNAQSKGRSKQESAHLASKSMDEQSEGAEESVPVQGSEEECGDENAESVGGSKQESVYLVTESIVENSEGDEESVTVQGSEDDDGVTNAGSVDCLNQESVFVAMESMDEEAADESDPVQGIRKRNKTIDLGQKGSINLIQLIKKAPCLWYRRHPQYRDNMRQNEAWKEISMQIGVPISQLQHKWRSLQSSYRWYSRAQMKGATPQVRWFAYDAMRFLSDMKEGGDTNAESVGRSKQESVYLVTESIGENSEGDEEYVTVQGSEDVDGNTKVGSVDCLNQESVFVAMESMDEEATEESVPVQGIRKRNKTVDLGQRGTIKLIHLIKKAPCLWYRRHPQYKNNMRQYDAWKEISMQMGVPISQLQHKWRSLQSSYRGYSKAQVMGAAPRIRWFAYGAMRFLSDLNQGGDMKAVSVDRPKQKSVCGPIETMDNNSEEAEESVSVHSSNGRRTRTVDLGTKGTIQFIKLVKLSVCLWNRKHPLYKDKMAQCKAWKEISMQMGVPSSELQYKWRSLQSSYRHFRSSYSKPRPYPTKRWFAYQAMRFLSDMKEVGDSNAQSVGRAKQVSVHLAVESMDEHSEGAAESVPVQGMKEYGDTKEDLVSMSNENTLYLISLIKSHGCVWNKQDADHKNATRKQEAWESISQAMGYSVEALQDKFTSLRSAYRNYCSRYRKNGDAKPSWFAYDALRFLDDKSHDDQPLDTNLIPDEGSQALSENFPVEKIKTEPMSDVVTIVNLRDKSVICKRVNQVSSKYPTRNPSKLDAQMDGRLKRILPIQKRPPIVIRRVTQPQTRVKDPLQIEDPLQIKLPTDARQTITYGNSQPRNSDAGSGTRLSSVKSFLSYLEHELCQLSKESMTLAQMEMLQIMSDYKLRDIRKSQSQTDAKKAKSMESTGTQTDPVNETVKGTIVSSELCFAELSLEHGDDNLFFNH